MKILVLLFAMYMVSLSYIPCSDSDVCNEINSNHQDEHKDTKACSPFCICACCHTVSNSPVIAPIIKSPEKIIIASVSIYPVNTSLQDVLTAIWQPPRIAA